MTDRSSSSAPPTARVQATVRAATTADRGAVLDFLAASDQWPADRLEAPGRIFDYAWQGDVPDRGFVVVDADGAVQGYCGGIHSRRATADGGERRVYSFSFYYVVPAYRAYSLALLGQPLRDRTLTFTSLTPAGVSQTILPRFGFATCSTGFWLCPPLPTPRVLRSAVAARVVRGADAIEPLLGTHEARILRDHRPYRGGHYLLRSGGRACYIVTQPRALERGRGARVSEVLYVGDRSLAAEHWDRLVWSIALGDRTVGVAVDEMFCGERPPVGLRRARVRMFRGPGATAADVDALYSELVLLQA